jgi:DNA-binding CsgD family transcriptional regulator
MMQACCVKLSEGGRALGILCLFRTEREPAFGTDDLAILERLHHVVVHGLRSGPTEDGFVDSEDRAMAIVDRDGRLLHLSDAAHRLLLMALVPQWAPPSAQRMRLERPPEIADLCRGLTTALAGAGTAPPVLQRRNAWGEFVLRAYRLGPADGNRTDPFVGVTIERREPRALRLLKKIEALPLTQREKELCHLLASGRDTKDMARSMGVSEHTIVAHRRNLYGKLGVDSRVALIERFHAG